MKTEYKICEMCRRPYPASVYAGNRDVCPKCERFMAGKPGSESALADIARAFPGGNGHGRPHGRPHGRREPRSVALPRVRRLKETRNSNPDKFESF